MGALHTAGLSPQPDFCFGRGALDFDRRMADYGAEPTPEMSDRRRMRPALSSRDLLQAIATGSGSGVRVHVIVPNSGDLLNSQFTTSIPRLKLKLEVGADETLLGALEAADANSLFNCRNGECGLCAVEVFCIDGVIEHCDVFFHRSREGYCQPTVRRRIPHLRRRSHDRTPIRHR